MADTSISDHLNTALADATVLWYALHNDHWNVTGEQFFALHQKFEEMYTAWGEHSDAIAERILALGGLPVGTLKNVLERSTLAERKGNPDAVGRVRQLASDLTAIHATMRTVIEAGEEIGDRGTVNLLDGICDEIETDRWMLRAFAE